MTDKLESYQKKLVEGQCATIMTEANNPSRSTPKKCGTCRHGGPHFKIANIGTHLHCVHPDDDIADIPPKGTGWGTLREWYATCEHWEQRVIL